jgi:drug/metabolite transporter (DMT)-like permease
MLPPVVSLDLDETCKTRPDRAVLLGERMAPSQVVGVALALAGVLFVIAKGDLRNLLAVRFTVGDGWVLVAGISWVAYSVLLRLWPSVPDSAGV